MPRMGLLLSLLLWVQLRLQGRSRGGQLWCLPAHGAELVQKRLQNGTMRAAAAALEWQGVQLHLAQQLAAKLLELLMLWTPGPKRPQAGKQRWRHAMGRVALHLSWGWQV